MPLEHVQEKLNPIQADREENHDVGESSLYKRQGPLLQTEQR